MLWRVVRPMKRRESSKQYFRQRIPIDVLARARGAVLSLPIGDEVVHKTISANATDVKISLRTSDPSATKIRQGQVAAYLESYWQSLRNGPTKLTHKQCVALSGELYRLWVKTLEDNPGSPEIWDKVIAMNKAAQLGEYGIAQLMIPSPTKSRRSLEDRFGAFIDLILAKRGMIIDTKSRDMLLAQSAKAMNDAATTVKRFAEGDYAEDETAKRFPKWEQAPTSERTKPFVTITSLLEGWWKEARISGTTESTYDGYSRTISYLIDFLKHDDAKRVSTDDVVAFKDHRLHTTNPKTGKTASPKTVKDSDLAALKSIFGWGLSNKKVEYNPALGVTIKIRKKAKTRPNYFKPDERMAILELAKGYKQTGREGTKLAAAKRWVPWICAYSGARVGEIVQLRKQDIRQEQGYWTVFITPEAGTVKDKEYREVPIHAHLIEEGFLDFVHQSDKGYLFIEVAPSAKPTGKVRTLKNDLVEFVRSVVPDPEIAPNHGWRHTFKTLAREVDGMNMKVIDDIVGHSARTSGERYGASTIVARANAMKKFPRLY